MIELTTYKYMYAVNLFKGISFEAAVLNAFDII